MYWVVEMARIPFSTSGLWNVSFVLKTARQKSSNVMSFKALSTIR